MNPPLLDAPVNADEEIPQLIELLLATEQRLEELTAGEVDSVAGRDGRTFLLRRAQEQLRRGEAAKQAAILNALPARIALLDAQGCVISVNEPWCQFIESNALPAANYGVGIEYPEVCGGALGDRSTEAGFVAAGIRKVLRGELPIFLIEYTSHLPSEQRWFLMTVTPLANDRLNGAVVMHVNITERKRAEESLRLQARMLDSVGQAVIATDPAGLITYANRCAEKLYGWSSAEIVGRQILEITVPKIASEQARQIMVQLQRGESWTGEFLVHDRAGRAFQAAVTNTPLRDQRGELVGIIGISVDITERLRAEHALRASEERLRSYFEAGLVGMSIMSPTQRFLEVNTEFCQILGYPREELLEKTWAELTHPDDLPAALAKFDRVCAGEMDGYSLEKRFLRKDGGIVHARIAVKCVRRPDGAVGHAVGLLQDITEHKRDTDALHASEKRFKALFEQAAVGVVQTDAVTGRFVQINQRFCDIVGRTPEEMTQLTFSAITHPDDIERGTEMMQQLRTGTLREFTHEKRYIKKDRTEVWANVTVSAMWAPGEEPDFFLAVGQDITGKKRLEEQIRLAQKMDAIGTLAGGIAHDFNNILAAINGYTEISRMILKDNPEVRGHLGSVLEAASRATHLVRQILTFSRQQPLERRPIQLLPVVAEALTLLRATIPSTIEFETALPTNAPTVLADATQVHQILMNLGTNAWHAMKDQTGRLKVTLERCVVDATHAATHGRLRPGVYARLSVSDTGCGMDQATQRRIFEPFFTTKAPGDGTGLGLAVVHGIMDTHEGAIAVYSQPGEGTVFHLYFPAHVGVVAADASTPEAAPRGHGERILFIDDEELLAQLGQRALVMLGYEVEIALLPAVALAMVRADPQRFAVVITDQTMPRMTGLVLAAELQQIRPELPIILTTGYSLSLTTEDAEAAGLRQLLLKPFTIHSLGRAVHAALLPRSQAKNVGGLNAGF